MLEFELFINYLLFINRNGTIANPDSISKIANTIFGFDEDVPAPAAPAQRFSQKLGLMMILTATIINTVIPNFLSPPYHAMIPTIAAGIVIAIPPKQGTKNAAIAAVEIKKHLPREGLDFAPVTSSIGCGRSIGPDPLASPLS
jgi:hypothetical protein